MLVFLLENVQFDLITNRLNKVKAADYITRNSAFIISVLFFLPSVFINNSIFTFLYRVNNLSLLNQCRHVTRVEI